MASLRVDLRLGVQGSDHLDDALARGSAGTSWHHRQQHPAWIGDGNDHIRGQPEPLSDSDRAVDREHALCAASACPKTSPDSLGGRVNRSRYAGPVPGADASTRDVYKLTLDKKINTEPDYVLGTFFWHMDGVTLVR
jgi:hypothetical protein